MLGETNSAEVIHCDPDQVEDDRENPSSPFVTFGKTPPKVFKSKRLQLFGGKPDIALVCTVLPAKSDSDVMFCLQSYQGLRIDRSLVYQSYLQDSMINTQVIYQFPLAQMECTRLCFTKQNTMSLSLYLCIYGPAHEIIRDHRFK